MHDDMRIDLDTTGGMDSDLELLSIKPSPDQPGVYSNRFRFKS